MSQVAPRYREPLPAELERIVKTDGRLRINDLLPVLHDLLVTQLMESTWPADASLKQYLAFSAEQARATL